MLVKNLSAFGQFGVERKGFEKVRGPIPDASDSETLFVCKILKRVNKPKVKYLV